MMCFYSNHPRTYFGAKVLISEHHDLRVYREIKV